MHTALKAECGKFIKSQLRYGQLRYTFFCHGVDAFVMELTFFNRAESGVILALSITCKLICSSVIQINNA